MVESHCDSLMCLRRYKYRQVREISNHVEVLDVAS